jgi:hypothetical protein
MLRSEREQVSEGERNGKRKMCLMSHVMEMNGWKERLNLERQHRYNKVFERMRDSQNRKLLLILAI